MSMERILITINLYVKSIEDRLQILERVHIEQTAPKPLSLDLINSKLPLQQVGEITEFENLLLENEDAVKQFVCIYFTL